MALGHSAWQLQGLQGCQPYRWVTGGADAEFESQAGAPQAPRVCAQDHPLQITRPMQLKWLQTRRPYMHRAPTLSQAQAETNYIYGKD